MIDLKVLKIGVSALIHDLGKVFLPLKKDKEFLKRILGKSDFTLEEKLNYCPREYSHQHVLYTVIFIENFKNYFPQELIRDTDEEKREGNSFINLAGKHHKPETELQWIIAEADRLSSGMDRQTYESSEEESREYYEIARISLFQNLFQKNKKTEWCYTLEKLSFNSILPTKDLERVNFLENYRNLTENFVKAFKSLENKENLYLWVQNLDSLLKIYFSFVPAARIKGLLPDISLYDHLRMTASLAIALYKYHLETSSLREVFIKEEKNKKFLLISGDFYGIQKFIFDLGEVVKQRAKTLRGRSFAVSLYTQLASEWIVLELGLNFLSIFLNTAGKFHILAPNLTYVWQKLENIKEEFDKWFYENFYLESGIGIAVSEVSPEELIPPNFRDTWRKHLEKLEDVKFKRFDFKKFTGVIEDYLDQFRNDLRPSLCPFCKKRPSQTVLEDGTGICFLCEDYIKIGENLVKNKRIKVFLRKEGIGDLNKPFLDKFQIEFEDREEIKLGKEYIKYFQYQFEEKIQEEINYFPTNGYVPIWDGRILTFEEIAKKALIDENQTLRGVDYLGVLKGDVDNLGFIFSCGFEDTYFNISRLVTLSRDLENFFGFYIPSLIKRDFPNLYTVFSGGDDFFIIGPWNEIIKFLREFKKKFKQFVCENEKVTFSAGYLLHKHDIPFAKMAELVEEKLEKAKKEGKDRICIFDKTIEWDELEEVLSIKDELENWLKERLITKSFLYRINEIIEFCEMEGNFFENKPKSLEIENYNIFKWRAYLYYFISRNVKKRKEELLLYLAQKLTEKRGKIQVPLWWLLYEYRKVKG